MTQTLHTAADTWERLTGRQRLARLLMVLSETTVTGAPTEDTLAAAAEGVGAFHGPPLLGSPLADRTRVAGAVNRHIRRTAEERVGLAPLIGANAECGLVYSVGRGGTDVPYPAVLGQLPPSASYTAGRQVGLDVAACGYDWALQPSVDVRVRRDDPVIGVRSFGSDPVQVSDRAAAYIQGIQSTGVMAAAKHFPGHGDASTDSHVGLPLVRRGSREHRDVHLAPFRAAIEAGVASIMTGHVVLPALGIDDVATFSAEVCRDLLRDELGYDGVLVSDSLRMRAVSDRFGARDSVVRALRAGNDVVNIKCAPGGVAPLLDELETAVRGGELRETDLYRAFERVLTVTDRALEDTGEVVPDGTGHLDTAPHAQVRGIADRNGVLPLPTRNRSTVGVLIDPHAIASEPWHVALEDLSGLLGLRLVELNECATTTGVDALVVLSRGQSGPSETELALVRAAERADLPAAVLLAGPTDVADRCPTILPTVQAPCVDVFGILTRSTAYPALRTILGEPEGGGA